MKILLIHNRYKQYGGEDATFETERDILREGNHLVKTLVFDNSEIVGPRKKLKLIYQLFYNRNSAKKIEKEIVSFAPDIIHVHNFFYLASPSIFFVAHRYKIPIVVTIQNYRLICSGALLMRNSKPCELCINSKFPSAGIRYGCHQNSKAQTAHLTMVSGIHKLLDTWNNKITKYITVTEFGRNKLIHSSLHLSPEKVVVKPSSVSAVDYSSSSEREDFFLFVGRLSEEKGIMTLLESFNNKSSKLEIIGDGPLRGAVEEAVARNPNITYSGYRDKAYIVSRLRKCLALVFTSVWYECLPVTILEAFSTGTPVVISNIGNLNEIVTHNLNGLHFESGNSEDLYRVISGFESNKARYVHLYEKARSTYMETYTPVLNLHNLIGIYRDAIQNYK